MTREPFATVFATNAAQLVLLLVFAGLVASVDFAIGNDISLVPLYLVIVVVSAWRWSWVGALCSGVVCLVAAILSEYFLEKRVEPGVGWGDPSSVFLFRLVARFLAFSLTGTLVVRHRAALRERDELVERLQRAVAEVQTLRGLLPLCAWCRCIRDENGSGEWLSLEDYLERCTGAQVTHGICPRCADKLRPPA